MHFNQFSHLVLCRAKHGHKLVYIPNMWWKSQIKYIYDQIRLKTAKMAPRKENRSERRRIATEREKKRIEAFNQQVERIRELVCPEMSCPTKSKILRAAVDRLNYLENLAEKLSTIDQNFEIQQNYEAKETENENSSGYNSDEAPVNYSQQCELSNDTYPQEFYNPYYQESVLPETTEQYHTSVEQHQATDYFEANTVELQIQDKQESYDNFFRQFLQE